MVIELLAESSGEREVESQVQSYNYTTELTQWGQWSCNTAPLRAWMLQSRTWTWSLLLPPPSQEWMIQHGPFFFLSPASHSEPCAGTYDQDFPAHGTHAPVAMEARKCHITSPQRTWGWEQAPAEQQDWRRLGHSHCGTQNQPWTLVDFFYLI